MRWHWARCSLLLHRVCLHSRNPNAPSRLAPGSRIHTTGNALVVSGGLVGQSFVVNYTRDSLGQAHDIWLLNAAEAADRRPGSEGMTTSNIVSDPATSSAEKIN